MLSGVGIRAPYLCLNVASVPQWQSLGSHATITDSLMWAPRAFTGLVQCARLEYAGVERGRVLKGK